MAVPPEPKGPPGLLAAHGIRSADLWVERQEPKDLVGDAPDEKSFRLLAEGLGGQPVLRRGPLPQVRRPPPDRALDESEQVLGCQPGLLVAEGVDRSPQE